MLTALLTFYVCAIILCRNCNLLNDCKKFLSRVTQYLLRLNRMYFWNLCLDCEYCFLKWSVMVHLFVSTLPLLICSVMPTLSEETQCQMMIMEALRKLILTTRHITIGSSHHRNKSPFLLSSLSFSHILLCT